MAVMKAELTAENRPAWEHGQRDMGVKGNAGTHKNQGGIEILIILLHVIGVVLHRLPFVHGIEIKLGVIVLDWLEVHPERCLNANWNQLESQS